MNCCGLTVLRIWLRRTFEGFEKNLNDDLRTSEEIEDALTELKVRT